MKTGRLQEPEGSRLGNYQSDIRWFNGADCPLCTVWSNQAAVWYADCQGC